MNHPFQLISSETKDLTPDLAKEFSTMAGSVSERDLKPKRLAYLKESVLNGMAITFNWATVEIADTGKTIRMNGNHSSNVLSGLDGAFPEGLRVHIDHYRAPSMLDAIQLFRQMDSRMSARTVDDVAGAYQGLHEDLRSTPKDAARKAIDAVAWYRKLEGVPVPSGDDHFDLFNQAELHPFVQMVGRILSKKTPEFTTPVLGAMFGTHEKEPRESESFWTDVSKQGGQYEPGHPTVVLDQWLSHGEGPNGAALKPREIYRGCVIAWNAFRRGRSLPTTEKPFGQFDSKKSLPDID